MPKIGENVNFMFHCVRLSTLSLYVSVPPFPCDFRRVRHNLSSFFVVSRQLRHNLSPYAAICRCLSLFVVIYRHFSLFLARYAPLPASVRSLDHCAVLNKGTDEELTARGFRRSLPRLALWYLTSALLALTPLLLAHWRPDWRLKLTHRRCALQDATAVLLKVRYR